MPNLNTKRFTNADLLRTVRRESLLQWLSPARDWLQQRTIQLFPEQESAGSADCGAGVSNRQNGDDTSPPAPLPVGRGEGDGAQGLRRPSSGGIVIRGPVRKRMQSEEQDDMDKLAAAFLAADDTMPAYLAESVFLIHEMADATGMDAILEAAERHGLDLQVGDEPAPADVAVQAWLQAPELLEEIHHRHQITRARSLVDFACATDRPRFTVPTPEQLRALEGRLAAWFGAMKRGHGCRVLMYPKAKECCFLVQHGEPCRREGAVKDGKSETVFYRPQSHDVVIYDLETGELRMKAASLRQMREYREAFGMHLFGDDRFFPGELKYTLAPLMTGRECLACVDIEGLDHVVLKEVEIFHPGFLPQRVTRKAEDIYALAERGLFQWPKAGWVTRATFEVRFTGARKGRRVKIVGANKAQYGRDGDSEIVEHWLQARGFIIRREVQDARLVA